MRSIVVFWAVVAISAVALAFLVGGLAAQVVQP